MRIPTIYWIIAYILGIVVSWNNIYSARFMIIMWGLCVIIYMKAYDKLLDSDGERK